MNSRRSFRSLVCAAAQTAALPLAFCQDPTPETAEPNWTVRTHRAPAPQLIGGYPSPDRGQMTPPQPPGEGASDEAVRVFLEESTRYVTHHLELQGFALPKGTVFAFDPETSALAARLPETAQEGIAAFAEAALRRTSHYIRIDLHLFESAAESLREVAAEASQTANHRPLMDAMLERAQAEGRDAEILATMRLETRSGQRVNVQRVVEAPVTVEPSVTENGWLEFDTKYRNSGTTLEVDPVIGPDSETIDVTVALEHHFEGPVTRSETVTTGPDSAVELALTDFPTVNIRTATTLRTGWAKLLGVWTPAGAGGHAGEGSRLQAAFFTADVVATLPRPDPRMAQWIEAHGDAVAEIPPGELQFDQPEGDLPPGMIVRRFQISPQFLASAIERQAAAKPASPADPVSAQPQPRAPSEPRFEVQATVKDILAALGVAFPDGASANFMAATGELVVRNTPQNMQKVEAVIAEAKPQPSWTTIALTSFVVEADAALLRRLADETRLWSDHRFAWDEVLQAESASVLRTAWIETRSGQRAKISAGQEFTFPVSASAVTAAAAPQKTDDRPAPPPVSDAMLALAIEHDMQKLGYQTEFDPVINADGKLIDLNCAITYHYAPPAQDEPVAVQNDQVRQIGPAQTTFREAKVSSTTTMRSGSMRLLGIWRPENVPRADAAPDSDVLQALFLRTDIVHSQKE